MKLDRNLSMPLYEQLRLILQDKILMGDLPPGSLLPTEKELCNEYDISRITSRKALEELARSGLITRVQGKGSIVTDRKISRSPLRIKGHTGTMQEQGYRSGGKLLEKKVIKPTENLLRLFELPPDSNQEFWFFQRLRNMDDTPVVIMNSYVRKELGDRMLEYNLDSSSFYEIFESLTNRLVVDNRALISATVATPEVASLLETGIGDPLIWFRGVSFLEGNIPIEVNYSLFLAEKFHFATTFYRATEEAIEDDGLIQNSISPIYVEAKGGEVE